MKEKGLIFLGLFILFLLFFLQFPLQNSLTGNLDVIANLAMYKQMKLHIDSLFMSADIGTICYPIKHPGVYFGADYGIGIIHIFFNYLGFSDLWANWIFISILFSLNSFTLYLFLTLIFKDKKIALIGGILFSFSHFILANLENPNVLFFAFFFLSLYYYKKYLDSGGNQLKLLYIAAFFGCTQIYLAPYIFVLHTIVWFIFIITQEPQLFSKKFFIKYIKIALFYLVIIAPYLYFFIFNDEIDKSRNTIFEQDITFALSLNFGDFVQVLPNHLYLKHKLVYNSPLLSQIKSTFLGVTFYSFALYGLFKSKNKTTWVLLIVAGIIIAIGPYFVLTPHKKWPFVLYPFYEYLSFRDLLRMPLRAYFITLFGLLVLVLYSINFIKQRYKTFPFWVFIPILILIENVPYKMEVYEQQNVLNPDKQYIDYLSQKDKAIVLNLPSELGLYDGDRNEYIYMYWQYYHQKTILNGNLAFIPDVRIETDNVAKSITEEGLKKLIGSHDITTIAFHKDLVHDSTALSGLDSLYNYSFLNKSLESDRTIIFEVN